jgi:hypothetical protein
MILATTSALQAFTACVAKVLGEMAGATEGDDSSERLAFGGHVEGPDLVGLPRAPPGGQGDLPAPSAATPGVLPAARLRRCHPSVR